MKKQILIAGNGFASLFFVSYVLKFPVTPFFTFFLRRLYSHYEITVIGNGHPAIPRVIEGRPLEVVSLTLSHGRKYSRPPLPLLF